MRTAIALIWLSLFWTLLCFLFYRDRDLIVQASLPVWIAAAAGWIAWRAAGAALASRWRRRKARPSARKRAAAKKPAASKPPAGAARRTPRGSAAGPRRRSS